MENRILTDNESGINEKVEIKIAASREEREAIYRMRYQIYVEEMGKQLNDIDHLNKQIYDDLDDWSILLYAQAGNEIVGTTRLNIGKIDEFPPYLKDFFRMGDFQEFCRTANKHNLCFSSKIMVTEAYRRRSQVTYLLVTKGYEISRDYQTQFLFGGSAPYVVPFYENLGFRRYTRNAVIPDYGYMIPYVLITEDIEHLRAVRSPLWRVARRKSNSPEAAQWFYTCFAQANRYVNSQLISKEEQWNLICGHFGHTPEEVVTLLKGLTMPEAQLFLHNFVIVDCRMGDQLISANDMANEVFIVLNGILDSRQPGSSSRRRSLLIPGQVFGQNAFLKPARRGVNVTAATDCEVLVLPLQAFDRLKQTQPALTAKVLENVCEEEYVGRLMSTHLRAGKWED